MPGANGHVSRPTLSLDCRSIGPDNDPLMRAAGALIYAPVNLVIQFKQWLVACSAPSHYRNQCWFIVNWNHICINFSQISMLSGKCRSLCSSLDMSNYGNSIWPNPCEHTILGQVRNDIGLVLLASRLFRPSYGTLWHLFITSQRPSTSVLLVVLHVQMGKQLQNNATCILRRVH